VTDLQMLACAKLGLSYTTPWEALSAVLRGWQRLQGLPVTGELDEPTVALLGPRSTQGLVPLWWPHDAERVIRERVGDEQAVRRFQSAHRMTPTGHADEALAIELGD
jgi:peptidoglycan hydrolase-like protein with peptidoglycan-binding domain